MLLINDAISRRRKKAKGLIRNVCFISQGAMSVASHVFQWIPPVGEVAKLATDKFTEYIEDDPLVDEYVAAVDAALKRTKAFYSDSDGKRRIIEELERRPEQLDGDVKSIITHTEDFRERFYAEAEAEEIAALFEVNFKHEIAEHPKLSYFYILSNTQSALDTLKLVEVMSNQQKVISEQILTDMSKYSREWELYRRQQCWEAEQQHSETKAFLNNVAEQTEKAADAAEKAAKEVREVKEKINAADYLIDFFAVLSESVMHSVVIFFFFVVGSMIFRCEYPTAFFSMTFTVLVLSEVVIRFVPVYQNQIRMLMLLVIAEASVYTCVCAVACIVVEGWGRAMAIPACVLIFVAIVLKYVMLYLQAGVNDRKNNVIRYLTK